MTSSGSFVVHQAEVTASLLSSSACSCRSRCRQRKKLRYTTACLLPLSLSLSLSLWLLLLCQSTSSQLFVVVVDASSRHIPSPSRGTTATTQQQFGSINSRQQRRFRFLSPRVVSALHSSSSEEEGNNINENPSPLPPPHSSSSSSVNDLNSNLNSVTTDASSSSSSSSLYSEGEEEEEETPISSSSSTTSSTSVTTTSFFEYPSITLQQQQQQQNPQTQVQKEDHTISDKRKQQETKTQTKFIILLMSLSGFVEGFCIRRYNCFPNLMTGTIIKLAESISQLNSLYSITLYSSMIICYTLGGTILSVWNNYHQQQQQYNKYIKTIHKRKQQTLKSITILSSIFFLLSDLLSMGSSTSKIMKILKMPLMAISFGIINAGTVDIGAGVTYAMTGHVTKVAVVANIVCSILERSTSTTVGATAAASSLGILFRLLRRLPLGTTLAVVYSILFRWYYVSLSSPLLLSSSEGNNNNNYKKQY
ncbi:hypothetical protein FRACYDRAFT_247268 [Fragilariopsis cylindrus CCMP1102]|uniref:Uncharacterized protein n=1 Tax=Fragilariopsis cylindrus CCMP1102 TaxID=635003 RepID=A0A1E7EWN8_9STRA|nr:hypothetical protein FRACYDRAFT_247268 [Fragilariopsis cylindrus CCMP1102]|eukprot:OEU10312.1 hypothetical protein FRACYDRAFT_247268 [Fragilariopsis cylindrus CCMP1102]